jgi:hypothetical protein
MPIKSRTLFTLFAFSVAMVLTVTKQWSNATNDRLSSATMNDQRVGMTG